MTQPEYVSIRRSDRAVEDEAWIADLLNRAPFGVFAEAIDGRPVIHSNLFAYDPARHAIIFHTSDEGTTYRNVQASPEVCFTVGEMGRLLPSATARGFSVEYQSVVAYGTIEVLRDQAEMIEALRQLMVKYAPHLVPDQDYRLAGADQLSGMAVYRLSIARWSGKRRPTAPDHPGAYRFEDVRKP